MVYFSGTDAYLSQCCRETTRQFRGKLLHPSHSPTLTLLALSHTSHSPSLTHLTSSQYPPVDPFTFNEVHGSSVSLDTQVDTLWDSKQPTHKLMNQFLETPLSPSQRVLALLTEQFLSSTSSSGYGTSNIEGEPDYYQTKLKDFTNSSRYVKEYFEHDPEGYVHMVPSRTQ